MRPTRILAALALALSMSCSSTSRSPGGGGGTGGSDAGVPPAGIAEQQRALAQALRPGAAAHFLFGLGNDLAADHDQDGAYTLGATLDLHYAYLVGLSNAGGWVAWNADGSFVDILDAAAETHGTTSMFDVYVFGALYEQGQNPIQDAATMDVYWNDVKVLATRLGALGRPFVVHHEPDAWGYIQQRVEADTATADTYAVAIHTATFHDCDDLPETVHGFGRCFVRLFRDNAPLAKIGFHASSWASFYDPTDPNADLAGSASAIAAFLLSAGAGETDFIAVDPLDRDAGYWETHRWDSNVGDFVTMPCDAVETGRGYPLYLDETNQTLPNYQQYLTWVRALSDAIDLPVIFWQVPLGVPSDQCGGTDGAYRDNHVHYFFAHVDELVAAGGVGAVFGVGAALQTYIDSDGDQFRDAVQAYYADPYALP